MYIYLRVAFRMTNMKVQSVETCNVASPQNRNITIAEQRFFKPSNLDFFIVDTTV